LYYHLVWATNGREPLITEEVEERLYRYLIGRAHELEVRVYAIGGWTDHVHLIVSVPPKHAPAYVVKHLKGASSHFANHELGFNDASAWQRGYGALGLGERQQPAAEAYVANQKEHHRQQTTNAWLEHLAEVDAGPEVAQPTPQANRVRESGPDYVTTEPDLPF
jgi:putative transposase